jgi:hypothetical protein
MPQQQQQLPLQQRQQQTAMVVILDQVLGLTWEGFQDGVDRAPVVWIEGAILY